MGSLGVPHRRRDLPNALESLAVRRLEIVARRVMGGRSNPRAGRFRQWLGTAPAARMWPCVIASRSVA